MNKELRDKKTELFKKWIELKKLMYDENQSYNQAQTLSKAEDEIYKKWKFYENFSKMQDKIEKTNERQY